MGCDHELGSKAVLDACGVCKGDNSTCKFYKGLYLNQHKANGKRCLWFHHCGFATEQVPVTLAMTELFPSSPDTHRTMALIPPRNKGGWVVSQCEEFCQHAQLWDVSIKCPLLCRVSNVPRAFGKHRTDFETYGSRCQSWSPLMTSDDCLKPRSKRILSKMKPGALLLKYHYWGHGAKFLPSRWQIKRVLEFRGLGCSGRKKCVPPVHTHFLSGVPSSWKMKKIIYLYSIE